MHINQKTGIKIKLLKRICQKTGFKVVVLVIAATVLAIGTIFKRIQNAFAYSK